MPFLLLLILTPPCLQEIWPEPGFGMSSSPARVAFLTWAAMTGAVAVAVLGAWRVRRRLAHNPGCRDSVLERYGSWRLYHLFLLAGAYGLGLYVFGWGWVVQGLFPWPTLPPGSEPLILAPFLVGLLASWVCFYQIERALHDTPSGEEGLPPTPEHFTAVVSAAATTLPPANSPRLSSCLLTTAAPAVARTVPSGAESRRTPDDTGDLDRSSFRTSHFVMRTAPPGSMTRAVIEQHRVVVNGHPVRAHRNRPRRERDWTLWQYLGYQIRNNLALVCLPVGLLIVLKAFRWLGAGSESDWGTVATALSILVAGGAFLGMPWMLRLILGLKPLPDGPLRRRLLAASRRLHFRCSDILLWNTRNGVANAMVAGLFPLLRYVVLTDRLIAELTPDEVEAVFGHEVGHVKHRHMLYYLGFLMTSMCAVWALVASYVLPHFEGIESLNQRGDLLVLGMVGLLGVYVFFVFGFVSRRCERQADIYGCRAVSCAQPDCVGHNGEGALVPGGRGLCPTGIRTFIAALEKVNDLNGMSRDRPGLLQSWQHSTIARRVGFLEQVIANPAVERRFQIVLMVLKWLLLLSLLAVILLMGVLNGWEKVPL